MGVALALAAMVSFASNILITRFAVTRMPVEGGFFVVLLSNVLFPLGLFCIELAVRATPLGWDWKAAGLFALGGVIGTYLGRRFLFDAVELLGPARASVFHSTAPAFALVGAWLLAREHLGGYELLLMAVIWTGLWFTQPRNRGAAAGVPRETLRRGMLAGLGAVAGFGFGNVLRGLGMRDWNEALLGAVLSSLAALVLQVASTRDWARIAAQFRAAQRGAFALYAGCGVATSLGSVFVAMAMRRMEIALAVLIVHTTPIVIFPVSVFVLGNREALAPRTLLGAGMVLAGIVLLALR